MIKIYMRSVLRENFVGYVSSLKRMSVMLTILWMGGEICMDLLLKTMI